MNCKKMLLCILLDIALILTLLYYCDTCYAISRHRFRPCFSVATVTGCVVICSNNTRLSNSASGGRTKTDYGSLSSWTWRGGNRSEVIPIMLQAMLSNCITMSCHAISPYLSKVD